MGDRPSKDDMRHALGVLTACAEGRAVLSEYLDGLDDDELFGALVVVSRWLIVEIEQHRDVGEFLADLGAYVERS